MDVEHISKYCGALREGREMDQPLFTLNGCLVQFYFIFNPIHIPIGQMYIHGMLMYKAN